VSPLYDSIKTPQVICGSTRIRASGKRVLVTGGAGFLGSHLCERLLYEGHEVISVDNFFTGTRRNIAHLLSNPRFESIRHDITDPINVEVDEIYNLACPASPVHYQWDPIHTLKTSFQGTLNILNLARRLRARVVQASTSEVYGDPTEHPQTEAYWGHVNPIGPRACYDEGKRVAETLCVDFHRRHGVCAKIIRIFNTYGPRMRPDDGRVVSNFIVQALRGEPITVYGEGAQTRSFCYVEDLINGIVAMMNASSMLIGPVNLGNPTEITVVDLAKLIVDMTRSSSPIEFKSLPADDPQQRRPDISLATTRLEWRPQVNLREGLRNTIEYFEHVLSEKSGVLRQSLTDHKHREK
jgi:UDP-glucuronate decarboxylase